MLSLSGCVIVLALLVIHNKDTRRTRATSHPSENGCRRQGRTLETRPGSALTIHLPGDREVIRLSRRPAVPGRIRG